MAIDRRERRLLILAGAFLVLYAIILTLAPAVRENSWSVGYHLSQWIGILVWAGAAVLAAVLMARTRPGHDPYILPLATLLSGWGMMMVWRLDSGFGLRQAVWVVASMLSATIIVARANDLAFLRRYKYLLLGTGLIMMALTLIFGTNPNGVGPRLWLGCCGVYLQPSEPLKLILVVYLAAYLADRTPLRIRIFPLLLPTVLVTGLALALLLVQRDLGTASILILLHTIMLYMATGKRRVLVATSIGLGLAALTGFVFVEIVHSRLDAWLNPWSDPTGGSYQIIQSLLAVANGGIVGRGPGLGSPSLVPVAHSDFIFSAIAEETGLVGTVGLLGLYALLFTRGILISLRASHRFHRLLAVGLTAYLAIQALIIIAGNLRMLPLTGVTLPFVSYGGSSLLTSFVAAGLLITMSAQREHEPAPLPLRTPSRLLAILIGSGILAAALAQGWWAIFRGPELLARTDNPRRSIADRYVPRGRLLDRNNQPIDITVGSSGSLRRIYVYPQLAPVLGYTHPAFGQAGLEASLDDYLRGLQGNPASLVWWDQLLYGTPPPGLDVRLSIDLPLQAKADLAIGKLSGAIILLDAHSGEILVMASHPTYDPNELDSIGAALAKDRSTPLVNRAAQGMYAPGNAIAPFLAASRTDTTPSQEDLADVYRNLGFYSAPQVRMAVADPAVDGETNHVRVSPLQMAVAAGALSDDGLRPAPRIALAVDAPRQGWIVLPALGQAQSIFSAQNANEATLRFAAEGRVYWEWTSPAGADTEPVTWFLGGTLPHWRGTRLTLVVLLESNDYAAARRIGEQLMDAAIGP